MHGGDEFPSEIYELDSAPSDGRSADRFLHGRFQFSYPGDLTDA